jgi:hypothetical protein
MSLQPRPWPEIPEMTARVARAAFPGGALAIRIRDALGSLFADEEPGYRSISQAHRLAIHIIPRRGATGIRQKRAA